MAGRISPGLTQSWGGTTERLRNEIDHIAVTAPTAAHRAQLGCVSSAGLKGGRRGGWLSAMQASSWACSPRGLLFKRSFELVNFHSFLYKEISLALIQRSSSLCSVPGCLHSSRVMGAEKQRWAAQSTEPGHGHCEHCSMKWPQSLQPAGDGLGGLVEAHPGCALCSPWHIPSCSPFLSHLFPLCQLLPLHS